MAVVEFKDDQENADADRVEIKGSWVMALVRGADGDLHQHWYPTERVKRVMGHKNGDDIIYE